MRSVQDQKVRQLSSSMQYLSSITFSSVIPSVALNLFRATVGYMGKVFHFIASKLTSY